MNSAPTDQRPGLDTQTGTRHAHAAQALWGETPIRGRLPFIRRLRHLIAQADLSGYGLVNAVTHFSQEVEDYDRATEFEALGGKLIELTAAEWKPLAEAA